MTGTVKNLHDALLADVKLRDDIRQQLNRFPARGNESLDCWAHHVEGWYGTLRDVMD